MSDNTSSSDKAKPTVFYATKSKEEKSKWSRDKQDSGHSKHAGRDRDRDRDRDRGSYAKSSSGGQKPERSRFNNDRPNDSKIETFKPRNKIAPVVKEGDSPWKNRVQKTEQLPSFVDESKTVAVQEKFKRQRKEETLIYSENSCKAVFANRPDSIIKAFFLQDKTYEFKALVAYLVEHRLGYDVIDDEKMAKIAQTPHHGGVCLIVKKRESMTTVKYLSQHADASKDYVLAIDDINNPHNLGGIARTAAFFGVNGLLLRQPDLLDNGAALRVSEGGAEYITPIKADDFIASLDQFKANGYQIVALLPCKVNSFKAEKLDDLRVKSKTVFVIFQQINTKLAEFADKVVYLQGSDVMPALNISVLTGILLGKISGHTTGK